MQNYADPWGRTNQKPAVLGLKVIGENWNAR